MAILPLGPDWFDNLTISTHPKRFFASSSFGLTGSVPLFANRSPIEKEAQKLTAFNESSFDEISNDMVTLNKTIDLSLLNPDNRSIIIHFARMGNWKGNVHPGVGLPQAANPYIFWPWTVNFQYGWNADENKLVTLKSGVSVSEDHFDEAYTFKDPENAYVTAMASNTGLSSRKVNVSFGDGVQLINTKEDAKRFAESFAAAINDNSRYLTAVAYDGTSKNHPPQLDLGWSVLIKTRGDILTGLDSQNINASIFHWSIADNSYILRNQVKDPNIINPDADYGFSIVGTHDTGDNIYVAGDPPWRTTVILSIPSPNDPGFGAGNDQTTFLWNQLVGSKGVLDGIQLVFELSNGINAPDAYGKLALGQGLESVEEPMEQLLELINSESMSRRKQKYQEIIRFEPPHSWNKDWGRYLTVKNVLYKHYKPRSRNVNWGYTNYHTINFFTASCVPTGSVLMYPAYHPGGSDVTYDHSYVPGATVPTQDDAWEGQKKPLSLGGNWYVPNGSFTFEFYMNPRYTTDSDTHEFHAGTLFHLSSSYVVSLVTGSSRSEVDQLPDGYRIMLQLSHSADIPPSTIDLSTANNARTGKEDLVFLSSDNSLKRNHWHHVAIRWGGGGFTGDLGLNGKGSFFIDAVEDETFTIMNGDFPLAGSGSIIPHPFSFKGNQEYPNVLFVGNYFDGGNRSDLGVMTSMFFNDTVASSEGVRSLLPGDNAISDPREDYYNFSHPLNAEVHELKIWSRALQHREILSSSRAGSFPAAGNHVAADRPLPPWSPDVDRSLLFYVPPFFVKDSSPRKVLQTPFQKSSESVYTDDPFNAALSFGLGGREINLENFTRDFAYHKKSATTYGTRPTTHGNYPRLFHLTSSDIKLTTLSKTVNDFLYESPGVRKRNLTILPNDNGLFKPNYELIRSGSQAHEDIAVGPMSKFIDEFGNVNLSNISLNDMIDLTGLYGGAISSYEWTNKDPDDLNYDPELLPPIEEIYTEAYDPFLGPGNTIYMKDDDGADMYGPYTDPLSNTTWGAGEKVPVLIPKSIFKELEGPTPEQPWVDPSASPGEVLALAQRFRESSSMEVVFFDASNLFYGQRIMPGSYIITDVALTGSDSKVKMTLKDNSEMSLYRADCLTPHATWNSVGNVFYEEGISTIKSPNIPHFGKDQFEVTMTGEQDMHVLEIHVPCPSGMFISSSNTSYKPLRASDYANDAESQFVYITGLNFHDENLNIIARSNLASPLVKRFEDKFLFRVKLDF
jgi:hypothetical protein